MHEQQMLVMLAQVWHAAQATQKLMLVSFSCVVCVCVPSRYALASEASFLRSLSASDFLFPFLAVSFKSFLLEPLR